jgi:hypothetical protein
MNRDEVLADAKEKINGPRAKDYGDAYENHDKIAKMWSAILGMEVTVAQVYQCMLAVKIGRLITTPEHEDTWVDIAGYAALGGEISEKRK